MKVEKSLFGLEDEPLFSLIEVDEASWALAEVDEEEVDDCGCVGLAIVFFLVVDAVVLAGNFLFPFFSFAGVSLAEVSFKCWDVSEAFCIFCTKFEEERNYNDDFFVNFLIF